MSITLALRRVLIAHRLRTAERAADYARSIRRDAEVSIHHHSTEASRLRVTLAQLERRVELARMGGV